MPHYSSFLLSIHPYIYLLIHLLLRSTFDHPGEMSLKDGNWYRTLNGFASLGYGPVVCSLVCMYVCVVVQGSLLSGLLRFEVRV